MSITYRLESLNTLHHSYIGHVHELNRCCKLFIESLTKHIINPTRLKSRNITTMNIYPEVASSRCAVP